MLVISEFHADNNLSKIIETFAIDFFKNAYESFHRSLLGSFKVHMNHKEIIWTPKSLKNFNKKIKNF
jgi:hypothetical protein